LKKVGEQDMAEESNKEEGKEKHAALETPLEEMTVKQLREIAKDLPELTGVSAMKKDELLAALEKQRENEGKKAEETAPEKPLDKMTAKELREIALEIPGVTGVHAMKKEQLLDVIRKYRGIEDEGPAKKRKTKRDKPTASVKNLKEKIARLREEKSTAREANDMKKVDVFRRRINRLKKQTRKVAQG
jgi:cell division protein FtsX